MSPTINTSIWLALKSHIETIPLGFPIAWPGMTFELPHEKDSIKPYIRAGRVNATPTRQVIDNGKPYTRTGILILTLVHPLGQTTSVFDEYAGVIAEHFNDSATMRYGSVCVTIPEYPQVVEGYEDGGYYNIPIRIPWRCSA